MTDTNSWPKIIHVHCTVDDLSKCPGKMNPLERAISRTIKSVISSPYLVRCHVLLSGRVAVKLATALTGPAGPMGNAWDRHYHAYYRLDETGMKWQYKHTAFKGNFDEPVETTLTLHRVVRPPTPPVEKLFYGTKGSTITYPKYY